MAAALIMVLAALMAALAAAALITALAALILALTAAALVMVIVSEFSVSVRAEFQASLTTITS